MQHASGQSHSPRWQGHRTPNGQQAGSTPTPAADRSALDGLWVLLLPNEGQLSTADADGRVPMMARAGDDQTYLLGFKNVAKARQFLSAQSVEGAEARMVVRGNKDELLRIAQAAGVIGILVDYDPNTQQYATASELF
jgi:hypothetical protein